MKKIFFDSSGRYELDENGERDDYCGPRDEYGKPVKHTREKYQYSYDAYVLWGERNEKRCNLSVYSDRLSEWDYEKTMSLLKKHEAYRGLPHSVDVKKIEAFLAEWHDAEKVELLQIVDYCNAGGYSVYRFDAHITKKKGS